jgi:acyl carrier protein
MSDHAERVRAIISSRTGSTLPILNGETLFDLDIAGTMDRAALAADVEDAFGIVISDQDVALWRTVGDVLAFVARCAAAGSIREAASRGPDVYVEAEPGEPCLGLSAREKLAPRAVEYLGLALVTLIDRGARPREDLSKAIAWFDLAHAMRVWQRDHGLIVKLHRSEHYLEAEEIIRRLARAGLSSRETST